MNERPPIGRFRSVGRGIGCGSKFFHTAGYVGTRTVATECPQTLVKRRMSRRCLFVLTTQEPYRFEFFFLISDNESIAIRASLSQFFSCKCSGFSSWSRFIYRWLGMMTPNRGLIRLKIPNACFHVARGLRHNFRFQRLVTTAFLHTGIVTRFSAHF